MLGLQHLDRYFDLALFHAPFFLILIGDIHFIVFHLQLLDQLFEGDNCFVVVGGLRVRGGDRRIALGLGLVVQVLVRLLIGVVGHLLRRDGILRLLQYRRIGGHLGVGGFQLLDGQIALGRLLRRLLHGQPGLFHRRFLIGDAPLLQGVVHGRDVDGRALIADLQLPQILLCLFQRGGLALTQDKEHIARLHLLAALDHDRADVAGLVGLDGVQPHGRDRARAAHLGGDGTAGHRLGRHLRQAPVHPGIGKESQHQQHGEENNGCVFDPIPIFRFVFHGTFILSHFQNWRCPRPGTPPRGGKSAGTGPYTQWPWRRPGRSPRR